MEIRLFFHEFSSKRMYGLEFDSLLKLIVTRWSADVICFFYAYCVIAAHAQIWMS